MSNELTDVRCPCGAEFQADSYDAGFIAGSGMCQNCDAALPPKDICTCPSGDGSLRYPCPAHPALVEQTGGDERAAFEAAASKLGIYTCNFERYTEETAAHENRINARVEDPVRAGDYRSATLQDCWKVWQAARAALAQPSTDAPYADGIAADLERSDWTPEDALRWYAAGKHFDTVNGRTRIIDTGAVASNALKHLSLPYLEMKRDAELTELREAMAQPSPAQAEAERPEVVARVVHSSPVVLGQCGPLNANDELMTVAQHAASVARWAEMFNRVEQERDAALARVAELEAKLSDPTAVHQWQFSNAWFDGSEEVVLKAGKEGSPIRTLYAAPVAQAQHSVPEVSGIGRDFAYPRSVVLYLRTEPTDDDLRAIHDGLRSLAAAPGKEGL
ncbi:TPA: hypothetical protein L3771_006242 [Pseudomonas aeruginosa]|nr:hypothetical protein [Pseudomonas aeruginosa]